MTNKFILFIVMLSCFTIHAQAGTGIFLQINNFTQSGVSIKQQSIKNWKPSHFTNSKIIPACSLGDKGKEQEVGFKSDHSHTYTETEKDVLGNFEHSLNLLAHVVSPHGYDTNLELNYGLKPSDLITKQNTWDVTYANSDRLGIYHIDALLSDKLLPPGLIGKNYIFNDNFSIDRVMFTLLPKIEDTRPPCPLSQRIWEYTLLDNFESAITDYPDTFSPSPKSSQLYPGFSFKTEDLSSNQIKLKAEPIVTTKNITNEPPVTRDINWQTSKSVPNHGDMTMAGVLCNHTVTPDEIQTAGAKYTYTRMDTTTLEHGWEAGLSLSMKQTTGVLIAKAELTLAVNLKYTGKIAHAETVSQAQEITIPSLRLKLAPKTCKRALFKVVSHPIKADITLDFEIDPAVPFVVDVYNRNNPREVITYTGRLIDLVLLGKGYKPQQLEFGSPITDPISGIPDTPVYVRGLGAVETNGDFTSTVDVWDVDYVTHHNLSKTPCAANSTTC